MKLTLLGTGSAKPFSHRFNAAQVLEVDGKSFMIDCGEGTQIRLNQARIRHTNLHNIFISHLHGDHIFGLIPLLSTWALQSMTTPLHIYAHHDLETLARPWLDYFCRDLSFPIHFHPINPRKREVIYQDRNLSVTTIPLHHTVPTCGFLFTQTDNYRHIIPSAVSSYNIPTAAMQALKSGQDFICFDGRVIPFASVTTPPFPPIYYLYMSDTSMLDPDKADLPRNINLLYHEATYDHSMADKARQRGHSTALQAARFAAAIGARNLLLGHFSSRFKTPEQFNNLLAEAQTAFPNTTLANDLQVIDIPNN